MFFSNIGLLLILLLPIILTVSAGLLGAFKGKAASNSIKNTNSENGTANGIIYKIIRNNFKVVRKHIKAGTTKLNTRGQKKSKDIKNKGNIEGLKMKQDLECKQGADKLFEIFVKNLVIDLTYDRLFDDIKNLRCVFVSTFHFCYCFFLHEF